MVFLGRVKQTCENVSLMGLCSVPVAGLQGASAPISPDTCVLRGASGSGKAIPPTAELGTEIPVWGMGTLKVTWLTPIPFLPVPPWEKSPQMLKGAPGWVFPWINTLIY